MVPYSNLILLNNNHLRLEKKEPAQGFVSSVG